MLLITQRGGNPPPALELELVETVLERAALWQVVPEERKTKDAFLRGHGRDPPASRVASGVVVSCSRNHHCVAHPRKIAGPRGGTAQIAQLMSIWNEDGTEQWAEMQQRVKRMGHYVARTRASCEEIERTSDLCAQARNLAC